MTGSGFLSHLRSYVGQPSGPDRVAVDEVNVPAIRRFVEAMGDANPVYLSERAARASGRTGMVAPPATLPVWTMDGYRATLAAREAAADPSRGVLGALAAEGFTTTPATNCRQEYHREMRPGDRLTARAVVSAVSEEKRTALGPAHFVSLESTFVDQAGEVVGWQTLRVVAFNPGGERRTGGVRQDEGHPGDGARAAAPAATPGAPRHGATVSVGHRLPALSIALDRLAVAACSAACNDFRSGHYDPDEARAIGMRDVFIDIPTSTALTARYASDWSGPQSRLRRVDVALGIPCCAGDRLDFAGSVSGVGPADEVRLAIEGHTSFGRHLRATVDLKVR